MRLMMDTKRERALRIVYERSWVTTMYSEQDKHRLHMKLDVFFAIFLTIHNDREKYKHVIIL